MAEELGLGDVSEAEDAQEQDEQHTESELSDSDSDGGNAGYGNVPLNHLRAPPNPHVAGWPLRYRQRFLDSNDALVDYLLKSGAIHAPQVEQAMKTCSRDQFVPGGVSEHPDVFADSPDHVTGFGFNISAPHMHATCLQALELKAGLKVLDVGSGSGLLSAYAAVLVGKTGNVDGIDCQKSATKLAKRNIRRQLRSNKAFAKKAAPCIFRTHNVFMPDINFQEQYDRIVAGASCPPRKVAWLLSLLKPSGGVLVTPVHPSDLQQVTKHADGSCTVKVLSQVRFSNLELPKEVSILKALIEMERAAALKPPVPESTFPADLASITGISSAPITSSSLGSEQTSFGSSLSASETPTSASSSWPRRMTKLFRASSSGSGSERCSLDEMSVEGGESPSASALLDPSELGPFDCALLGSDWVLHAHKTVLKNRSELFRAQCASGMRDAEATVVHVPEHFTKDAVDAFLRYCYTDKLEGCDSAERTASCLAVAVYYGMPHLVQLCELSLVEELQTFDEGSVKLAPTLLSLADDLGLNYLQARSLDFITTHHASVVADERTKESRSAYSLHLPFPRTLDRAPGDLLQAESVAFKSLTKHQTDLVAAHACRRLERINLLLDKMQADKLNPFDLL